MTKSINSSSIRGVLLGAVIALPLCVLTGCGAQDSGQPSDAPQDTDSVGDAKLRASLVSAGMSEAMKESIRTAPIVDAVEVPEGQEYKGVVPSFTVNTYCESTAGADALAIAVGDGNTGNVVGIYKLPAIAKCAQKAYSIAGGNLDGYVNAMIVGVNQGQDIHLNWVSTWSLSGGSASNKHCYFQKWIDGTIGASAWCS